MNFAEEVAGEIGSALSPHLLYEDETSKFASHIVERIHAESFGTSVVARVNRFASDGDTRIPLGRVRVTVTYEQDEPTATGEPS